MYLVYGAYDSRQLLAEDIVEHRMNDKKFDTIPVPRELLERIVATYITISVSSDGWGTEVQDIDENCEILKEIETILRG